MKEIKGDSGSPTGLIFSEQSRLLLRRLVELRIIRVTGGVQGWG